MSALSLAANPADGEAARKAALQYIARRDYCSGELRSKLRRRGYDAATAATVIAALEEQNVLNERRYVEHFIGYQLRKRLGPLRIKVRLLGLGIKHELIEPLLEADIDWISHARDVRRRKFGDALPMASIEQQRQSRYLQTRGFTTEQIRQALSG